MFTEDESKDEAITVRYVPDDEYMGRLTVAVRFAGFAGVGAAWVDRLEVSRFAEALKTYPIDQSRPIAFSSGLGEPGKLVDFIGLHVSPQGGKGQVVVEVRLASEEWRNSVPRAAHRVLVEFPTSYEFLRRFAEHLHLVLDGNIPQAVLDFEILI